MDNLQLNTKKKPIMLLYNVTSIDSPEGSLVSFALAAIGVLACAAISNPNLSTRFLAYFDCLM